MIFKSQIFAQVSGSAGGSTFAHNRGGLYMRARTIPVNPATVFQQQVRNAVAQLVARWSGTLSVIQRAAWNTYAFNVPLIGPTGDPRNVGGLGMYIRSNVPRLQASITRVDAAPTTFSLPDFTTPGMAVTASSDLASISFTNTDPWATAVGGALLVYLSRPQNQSILSFKGPYRFAEAILGAVVPPTSPNDVPLPFPAAVGNVIFAKFSVVTADGRLSSSQRLSDIAG